MGARAPGQCVATRTANGSEAQKPTSTRPRSFIAHSLTLTPRARRINPTKINRVGRRDEKARGPGCAEMHVHPWREQTCEGTNPMSAAGRRGKDQSSGQAAIV